MQAKSSILYIIGWRSTIKRFWFVALAAGIAATLIDLLIATIVTPLVNAPPGYASFTWLPILTGCIVGAFGALVVYSALWRFARRPIRAFLVIAVLVLVASYVLPILPIVNPLPRFEGVNWGIAFTLMFMHTVTAVIIVASLVAYGNKTGINSRGDRLFE